jgi:hypothetical protein
MDDEWACRTRVTRADPQEAICGISCTNIKNFLLEENEEQENNCLE